jgi:hypothetical protein
MKHGKKAMLSILLVGMAMPVFADSYVPGPLPLSTVIQRLDAAGYQNLTKVEYEDGKYKAKLSNSDGAKIEIKLSANNPLFTTPSKTQTVSASDAAFFNIAKNLEAKGYRLSKSNMNTITMKRVALIPTTFPLNKTLL